MEYTNEMGLISKPLLREIAEAIRKQEHSHSSIEVNKFADRINKLKPTFLVGGVIVKDNDLKIDNVEPQKNFNGFILTTKIIEA